MADVGGALAGLGALLIAVLGATGSVAAAAPIVTAPAPVLVRVGSPTTIAGASVTGLSEGPVRLVITVGSGTVELPGDRAGVTVPVGYPELGTPAGQLAIEGEEAAVNLALAELSWVPAEPGTADITVEAGPAGAAYEPESAHFYQVVTLPEPLTWQAARDAAASATFAGLPGSLAAITTDAEYALLARIAPVDAWFGAVTLGTPDGVRWLASADPAAAISTYVVEYADPLAAATPTVARATATLRAALAPSAPAIVGVTAGIGQATVRWQAPATDGGAAVLGYVVAGDPGGWCAVAAFQTSCDLRGLVGGAAHTFRVAALNEVGLGTWSEPSAPVVPLVEVVPTAPSDTVDSTVLPLPTQPPASDPVAAGPAPGDGTVSASPGDAGLPVAGAPAVRESVPIPSTPSATTPAPAPGTGVADNPPVPTSVTPSTQGTTASTATAAAPTTAVAAAGGPAVPAASGVEPPHPDAIAATVGDGRPTLTVVFAVGPGAGLAEAGFTVRATHLSPGTVVTVVAHSDPVILGTVDVGADGTVTWVGTLPAGLADGDHTLVADGVGADGSRVERSMPFTAEAGRLTRVGASAVETIEPTVATTAPVNAPVAEAATEAAPAAAGGGLPRRALALLLVAAAVGVLWWRARSRLATADAPATADPAVGGTAPAPGTGRAAATVDGRSRSVGGRRPPPGPRRRARRQPARLR